MSLQAITATEVRDHLETIPGISLPSSLTDTMVNTWIERKTATVLELRGLDALPTAATLGRDRVNGAVLDLVAIHAKRFLHPGREDVLKLLLDEEKLILRDIEVVKSEAAKRSGFGAGVTGAHS